MDYNVLRRRMVEEQIKPRGIKDMRVLEAFAKVERHKFIPEELRDSSYADYPIPIGEGQTISQPFIVALMTECLDLKGEEKVLEIGTGSGYQTAILAELANVVCTVERIQVLSDGARQHLSELGYKNIKFKVSDGTLGWKEESPFDRMIITAAAPAVPLPLTEQLKEGGKLILPVADNFGQMLTLITKENGQMIAENICPVVFVPLIGKHGIKHDA
jgi:protein-L-isoaspartate(D-aspartate) O-methyltransferase